MYPGVFSALYGLAMSPFSFARVSSRTPRGVDYAPRFPGAPIEALDLVGKDDALDEFPGTLHFERIALN